MTKSIVRNLGHKPNHGSIDIKKLSGILDDAYKSMNEPEFKQKTSFAPSTVGYGHGRCPRYWYIAFDGAVFIESREAKDYANMQTGTDAHERIGKLLERSKLDIKAIEQEFRNQDPPIHGFIDGIIDRKGEEVIVEIKTTRTEAFRARQAKMAPPDYHLLQILIYMRLRNAESGFFLYEDKNTHEMLVMPVYLDDKNKEIVDNSLQWMREVRQLWEDRTLPKNPYRANSKVCKKCPVRATCFDAEQYDEGVIDFDELTIL
ncbi:MAG: PD-(D/E)XK nuclease family protein [Actinobacteria bacterium]|nr:PD-(D/E)XK nuclease family protein [Actinomycetota bacterium]